MLAIKNHIEYGDDKSNNIISNTSSENDNHLATIDIKNCIKLNKLTKDEILMHFSEERNVPQFYSNNNQASKSVNTMFVKPSFVRVVDIENVESKELVAFEDQCVVIPSPAQLNQMISLVDFNGWKFFLN